MEKIPYAYWDFGSEICKSCYALDTFQFQFHCIRFHKHGVWAKFERTNIIQKNFGATQWRYCSSVENVKCRSVTEYNILSCSTMISFLANLLVEMNSILSPPLVIFKISRWNWHNKLQANKQKFTESSRNNFGRSSF